MSIENRQIIDTYPKPRRSANQIELKYTDISEPHVILGILTVRFNKGYKTEFINNKLRAKAASLGADGIIFKRLKRFNSGWQLDSRQNPRGGDIASAQYRRQVIMYRYSE